MNLFSRYSPSAIRYLLIAAPCAFTEWITFYLLISSGFGLVSAALAGFVIATAVNYGLSAIWVFGSRGRSRLQEIALTYLISLGVMTINLGITASIVSFLPQPPVPLFITAAKMIGTGCGFVLNYLGRQFFVFESRAADAGARSGAGGRRFPHGSGAELRDGPPDAARLGAPL